MAQGRYGGSMNVFIVGLLIANINPQPRGFKTLEDACRFVRAVEKVYDTRYSVKNKSVIDDPKYWPACSSGCPATCGDVLRPFDEAARAKLIEAELDKIEKGVLAAKGVRA